LARKFGGCAFLEASAKTKTNVDEVNNCFDFILFYFAQNLCGIAHHNTLIE
jgi:hypothetical protein